jgi:hypothetical protein
MYSSSDVASILEGLQEELGKYIKKARTSACSLLAGTEIQAAAAARETHTASDGCSCSHAIPAATATPCCATHVVLSKQCPPLISYARHPSVFLGNCVQRVAL